jgi:hypothetical protein
MRRGGAGVKQSEQPWDVNCSGTWDVGRELQWDVGRGTWGRTEYEKGLAEPAEPLPL